MQITDFHVFIKTLALAVALNFVVLSGLSNAAPESFAGYTMEMNGSATVVGGNLQLTPNITSQAGSAFVLSPFIVYANTSFSTYFQFVLNGGTGGADGFVFILQNDPSGIDALGGLGGSLGYVGISNSLAVEFDTYQNGGDPNNNHIGVNINGNVSSLATSTVIPDINSGSSLYAWIDYDGGENLLDIFVNTTNTKPIMPDLSHSVDLPGLVGSQAYIGFSAATGGLTNQHLIENWTYSVSQPAPIPALSEYGMIIMLLVLAGSAVWMIRRRQTA